MKTICIIYSKRIPLDLVNPVDGGAVNFIYIVNALRKDKNNHITILTRNESNNRIQQELFVDEIKIVLLSFEKCNDQEIMVRDYFEGKSFCESVNKYLSNISFNIIHTNHWSSAINIGFKASLWIHTPHLLAFAKKQHVGYYCPEFITNSERAILENCDKIIALSNAEKYEMMKYYEIDGEKITVIPNGISSVFFKSNELKNRAINQIVTIARITKQKRIELLIESIFLLHSRGVNLKLVIIGETSFDIDYFDSIRKLIKQMELQDSISFTGPLKQSDIKYIIDVSCLYIQTSYYESQGIAIIEAMAAGLPILTTKQNALDGVFLDKRNGFFVNENQYDIANKVSLLLENKFLYNEISYNNRNDTANFTWEESILKYLKIFN